MQKKKKVTILKTDHPGNVESMLSDVAKEGWMLESIKGKNACLIKGERLDVEYRVVCITDGDNEEQLTVYKELGWSSVEWDNDRLILYAKTKEVPSERYFTEQEKKNWESNGSGVAILCFIGSCIAALFIASKVFAYDEGVVIRYRNLIGVRYLWCYSLFPLIYTGWLQIVGLLRQRRYVKEVEEQHWTAHHRSWRRAFRRRKVISRIGGGIIVAILITSVLNLWGPIADRKEARIETIPIIRLEEVISEKLNSKDEYDSAYYLGGILPLDSYQYSEFSNLKSGAGCYIQEEYYQFYGLWNMKQVVRSLIVDSEWIDDQTDLYEKEIEGLDHCYYSIGENEYRIAASNGKQALYIAVDKIVDFETLTTLMKEKLNQ